jgi:hypothetical protein
MKLWFTIRNQKLNSGVVSGKFHLLHVWRKEGKVISNINSMLETLLECEDTVHQELVHPGQMVNQHHYQKVL